MRIEDQWLERIAGYLSGNSTPAERKELEQWLEAEPGHRQFFEEVRQLWQMEAVEEPFEADVQAAWQRLDQRLDQLPHSGGGPEPPAALPGRTAFRWVAAAAAVLLAGLLIWLWQPAGPAAQTVAHRTEAGEQKQITLPDGSQVWLNESTTLRYKAGFRPREVKLEGEGFFEVRRIEARPFTVSGKHTLVTVLGTAFNLRAYPEEAMEQVAVASGKVAVQALKKSGDPLFLQAGESSSYQKDSGQILYRPEGTPNAMSWRTGVFEYGGLPFVEAIPSLERYYRVEIRLENPSLGRCPLNGRFENKDLETILTTFALATGARVQRRGEAWVISGRGCR